MKIKNRELTTAEIETIKMLHTGHTQKEIARAFKVPGQTIHSQLMSAKDKLGAKTTAQVVSLTAERYRREWAK